jgi:hypothetical protein
MQRSQLYDEDISSLTANIQFFTKSDYQFLESDISRANNKWIWKSKLPLKIKIFMWQLYQDVNLTRENMRSVY